MTPQDKLKKAERGPLISISIYLLLASMKLLSSHFLQSSSLRADGFNNLSDILGNLAIFIGLRLARKPADGDHRFGHWKIEDLASLLTSFIMFVLGFQMLFDTLSQMISGQVQMIDPVGSLVGLLSASIMFSLYRYNNRLAKELQSGALLAAAKDNLSDALTSLGTSLAILASQLKLPILDHLVAILISFFILKTAYEIFSSSTFNLSDGFDDEKLHTYKTAILEIPKITAVKSQRGRHYGSNVYLDLVLEMHPDLSVYESHDITEQVEQMLKDDFGVYDIDIHVEPAPLPEDEIEDYLWYKLKSYERSLWSSRSKDADQLLTVDGIFVLHEYGQASPTDFLEQLKTRHQTPTNISCQSISQKTKRLTYTIANHYHTSLWRRHEGWQLIFHQETLIPEKTE